jgi:cytosine/adenosine deaminase-related metal-dependent hydrolase
MKRFSAQYVITNCGPTLKRPLITTEDDGTILSIEDTGGFLQEKASVEFHNGIIIPGFVNCHCHLELSHLKGSMKRGKGLGLFIEQVRSNRENSSENIIASVKSGDTEMQRGGIVLCADICNSILSFNEKKESRISYINLLEVFGIDPLKATIRMNEISRVAEKADEMKLTFSIVPHSLYSMSLDLLRLLMRNNENNKVTSIHFMETAGEKIFLENHTGPLMESYEHSGLIPSRLETVKSFVRNYQIREPDPCS